MWIMLHIVPEIFKAYDIRGPYPEDLNESAAYLIARAFAQILNARKVVVGYDTRTSSPKLFDSFVRGLVEEGVEVHVIGLASTPYLYFAVNQADYDGGVNITASHNPAQYNGLKLTKARGLSLSAASGLRDILKLIQQGIPDRKVPPGQVVQKDYSSIYLDSICRNRVIGNFKVALDTGNGMGGLTAPAILKRFPQVEVVPLFLELDGRFPNHAPNPHDPDALVALKSAIKQQKCDLGIAFDGDADRVAFVTAQGELVRGDIVTVLLAQRQLLKHPGSAVVYDLVSSWIVPEEIRKAGGTAVESKVGHSNVKEKMREAGAIFGGEVSLHYYFKDFYSADNGDYGMLEMLELLTESKKPLHELVNPLKRHFQSGEINIEVADAPGLLKAVADHYKGGEVSHLDGLSVSFPEWHMNIRPSNTEPVVRLNMEAKSRDVLNAKRNELAEIIAPFRS
jgi:phosphomannomutase